MRLFIAHFILVEEVAASRRHFVSSSLFASATAEDAYNTAQSWVQGHEDSTHDDAGDLVHYYSTGLYDLEEVLESLLTCPHCGFAKLEQMPTDSCQFFYECSGCKVILRPKQGHCCVFCSYGSVECPSMQHGRGCCA